MSEREREVQRDRLARKLRALVDTVMVQVDKDAAFADRLAQVLLSDSHTDQAATKAGAAPPKEPFNPVLFLKEHGEIALQRELEARTDDELRAIMRFQGLRKGKELKKLARAAMLQELAVGASAKLKQGMIVARVEAVDPPNANSVSPAPGTQTGTRDVQNPKPTEE